MELWIVKIETRHGFDCYPFLKEKEAREFIRSEIDDLLDQYPSRKEGCPDYTDGDNWSDALLHIGNGTYIDLDMSELFMQEKMIDGMTLWEAFLDDKGKFVPALEHGYCECRDAVAKLIPACMEAYEVAKKMGFDEPFDWEFCRFFLSDCVNPDLTLKPNYLAITEAAYNA